ncbi:hypothetical protein ElP_00500 [Tautonia plasticadhaerens]|uniref:Uncharacterized protein n=1 Tax=Tautonia plasticadhaerens TaxID=2527974 RepID=A0A518GUG2_9BACT|nr:hypothetical protein ElP_00500 [Tautonia plasticadhaerens]
MKKITIGEMEEALKESCDHSRDFPRCRKFSGGLDRTVVRSSPRFDAGMMRDPTHPGSSTRRGPISLSTRRPTTGSTSWPSRSGRGSTSPVPRKTPGWPCATASSRRQSASTLSHRAWVVTTWPSPHILIGRSTGASARPFRVTADPRFLDSKGQGIDAPGPSSVRLPSADAGGRPAGRPGMSGPAPWQAEQVIRGCLDHSPFGVAGAGRSVPRDRGHSPTGARSALPRLHTTRLPSSGQSGDEVSGIDRRRRSRGCRTRTPRAGRGPLGESKPIRRSGPGESKPIGHAVADETKSIARDEFDRTKPIGSTQTLSE